MAELFPMAIMVSAFAAVAWAVRWSKARRRLVFAAWEGFAGLRGLRYVPPEQTWLTHTSPRIEGSLEGVHFVVDTFMPEQRRDSSPYTRVVATALAPAAVCVEVHPEHALSGIVRLMGFQDVEIGDPDFDRAFVVRTDDVADARSLLDERTRAALWNFSRPGMKFSYDHGAVTLTWHGEESDYGVLDDACAIVLAACRWRRVETAYR